MIVGRFGGMLGPKKVAAHNNGERGERRHMRGRDEARQERITNIQIAADHIFGVGVIGPWLVCVAMVTEYSAKRAVLGPTHLCRRGRGVRISQNGTLHRSCNMSRPEKKKSNRAHKMGGCAYQVTAIGGAVVTPAVAVHIGLEIIHP